MESIVRKKQEAEELLEIAQLEYIKGDYKLSLELFNKHEELML